MNHSTKSLLFFLFASSFTSSRTPTNSSFSLCPLFCLQSHYRKPLEFSYEVLDNMSAAYDKLIKKIGTLDQNGTVDKERFDYYREKFESALCDDLNSSMAVTILYDMLKDDMSDATKHALAESFDEVLSLNLTTAHATREADNTIDTALESYVLTKIEERLACILQYNTFL